MDDQNGAKAETKTSLVAQSFGAYVDYPNADKNNALLSEFDTEHPSTFKQNKKSFDHSFPVKLHYMLTETDKDGLLDVVSWQPHGRCFLVHDQHKFVDIVLPNWFRQSKIASFQRQLNLYGFKRITRGRDKGAYYHSLFLRGIPDLAQRIQRTKIKGTGTRKPACPEAEPDFYSMAFLPPLTRWSIALEDNIKVSSLLHSGTGGYTDNNSVKRDQHTTSVERQMTGWRTIENPIRSGHLVNGLSYSNSHLNGLTVSSNALDLYKCILGSCMQSQGI